MMRKLSPAIVVAVVLSMILRPGAEACSSFTLRDDGVLIAGRNLDAPGPLPGLVVVNKRGVKKTGQSFDWLYGGERSPHPPLTWVSKYGSITFNYSGLEFPDGGMNEAGLVFQEMTLIESKYPADDSRAAIFMVQWIQYILDTCATVEEVVQSAHIAVLDGWNWHFYAVDSSGSSAAVEFLDGEVVVHTGEALRHPVLANSPYTQELKLLEEFEGFGGTTPIDADRQEIDGRFAKGASLLERYSTAAEIPPMKYAWKTLDAMSPGTTQSAQVYDITHRRIEFRSSRAPTIRSVSLDAFDLGCDSPAMVLDLDLDLEGDVSGRFEPYTVVNNSRLASENLLLFSEHPELQAFLEGTGVRLESIVARFVEYPGTTSCEVAEAGSEP